MRANILRSHMMVQEITFASDDYRLACDLRQEVLRAPLGLNLYTEDLNLERVQIHYGLFDESRQLLACVVAVPVSGAEAKLRQMAVRPSLQGKGYGRTLLQGAEQVLARRGFEHLLLHARMTAVEFYERLGYVKTGPEFIEVGIPHVLMERKIQRL